MRVTRKQSEANREKVLDVAGTLFRERGFDGIGVADIMKRAGLTHGGFYGQFASKDDLAAEATARVFGKAGLAATPDGKGGPIIRRCGPRLPVAQASRRSRNPAVYSPRLDLTPRVNLAPSVAPSPTVFASVLTSR